MKKIGEFVVAFFAFFALILGALLISDVLIHNPLGSRNEAIGGTVLLSLALAYFWTRRRIGGS